LLGPKEPDEEKQLTKSQKKRNKKNKSKVLKEQDKSEEKTNV
jgi:hypothetical protein